MKFLRLVIVVATIMFFCFSGKKTFCQTTDEQKLLEDIIERIASQTEEEIDIGAVYDDLNYYLQNPLNLNLATKEDLEKIPFLNDVQVMGVLNYVRKYGYMSTVFELGLCDGFDKESIELLLPFITVLPVIKNDYLSLNKLRDNGKNQILLRTQFVPQMQLGFKKNTDSVSEQKTDTRYLGNSARYYLKYKYQYKNKIYWGFTAEKDPGEEFFKGTQKQGFDFYSAHVQINNTGVFKKILLGDFDAQFGQGLVLCSGFSLGKSASVLNISKKESGLRKYSSSNENSFFRGAGTTISFRNINFTSFLSYKKIDGNTSFSDTTNEFTSFLYSGYHRLQSEIEDRHSVGEMVLGSNISYKGEYYKIGATVVHYSYSRNFAKDDAIYETDQFNGSSNFCAGIDYKIKLDNLFLSGEIARSQNNAYAVLNNAVLKVSESVSFSALHRLYQQNFQNYYASGFSESGNTNNESGLFLGTEFTPWRRWKISAYFDSYKFFWLKQRISKPSDGFEYLTQISYTPNRNVSMNFRFKNEQKQENISDDENIINQVTDVKKYSIRYHIAYQITPLLQFKNRIEYVNYQKAGELNEGFMFYQDILYKSEKYPVTLGFRYAFFDAPYNARIYSYENDVLYAFSVPGYYYRGYRTYLSVKYELNSFVDFWIRYSHTSYSDRNKISEGTLNEIDGNLKSEIKLQLRVKF